MTAGSVPSTPMEGLELGLGTVPSPRSRPGDAPAKGSESSRPATTAKPGEDPADDLPPDIASFAFLLLPAPEPPSEMPADGETSLAPPALGTPPPALNSPPVARLLASASADLAAPAAPVAETAPPMTGTGAVTFGTFQLQTAASTQSELPPNTPPPTLTAGPALHSAAVPPPAETKATDLGQRLKLLLESRSERGATPLAATAPEGAGRWTARNRQGSALSPIPADGEMGTLGQTRTAGLPSTPTAAAEPPAASTLAREILPVVLPRLPMNQGTATSASGVRLAFESPVHGAVGLDIRCTGSDLAVTIRLAHELAPGEAEACRKQIAAACMQRGYGEVQVDIRHGGTQQDGGERQRTRRGHAADEDVRLAGKEFPQGETPALLPAPAVPAAFAPLRPERPAGR